MQVIDVVPVQSPAVVHEWVHSITAPIWKGLHIFEAQSELAAQD